jgi:hypothetical protein
MRRALFEAEVPVGQRASGMLEILGVARVELPPVFRASLAYSAVFVELDHVGDDVFVGSR